jgi:hypothetical protein
MSTKHYSLMPKLPAALPSLLIAFFLNVGLVMSPASSPPGAETLPPPKLSPAIFSSAMLSPTILSNLSPTPPRRLPQDPKQSTLHTSSLESHEGITISARPWTDAAQYKEKFRKKSPFTAGVLAVQVAFRNDSDQSVKVGLERIRLSFNLDEENRQELQPLKADEVAEAVLQPSGKDPTKRRRLPLPITTGGDKGKDFTQLKDEAQNAEVPTSVVAAHSTVQGLLYFDMQGQFDLLRTAHLYIPDVAVMGKSQGLTYFEIDLSR